ncbi:hypothetical protein V6N13_048760 [Hibiscus sabdariffa]
MQAETKVFQQNLINFIYYQFPAAATYFNAQPEATPATQHSTTTRPMPSANPSAKAGNTEELHFSSDDENDVFDWQSPRDHLKPVGPTPSKPAVAVPILSPAPTLANRPIPDSPARRKSKTTAGRTITRSDPSSPDEEHAAHQPAQKRRRRHIITSDSDDENNAEVPTTSTNPSLSFTF